MRVTSLVRTLAVALALAGGACESDYQAGAVPTAPAQPAASAGAATPPGPGVGAPVDAGVDAGLPALAYQDDDFVESNVNRDPFRSFAKIFRVRPLEAPQRTVIMPTMGIDELQLIAIVSGVTTPRAMFLDGSGVGYAVERGDYIGRGDTIQTGGEDGISVVLNWRVDRIRDGEVVLTREDPTAPNRPPLTRVLALHDENETPRR
jgi:type IV pilus assembly protein PilP